MLFRSLVARLGRPVVLRAQEGRGHAGVRPSQVLAEPEVDELQRGVLRFAAAVQQEPVLRLDVTVYDVVPVAVIEGARQLVDQGSHRLRLEARWPRLQEVQDRPVHKLEDEVELLLNRGRRVLAVVLDKVNVEAIGLPLLALVVEVEDLLVDRRVLVLRNAGDHLGEAHQEGLNALRIGISFVERIIRELLSQGGEETVVILLREDQRSDLRS